MALAAASLLVLFTSPVWAPPTFLVGFGLGLLWPQRSAIVMSTSLSAAIIVATLAAARPTGAEAPAVVLTILLGAFLPACGLVSAAGHGVACIVRRHSSARGTREGQPG